MLRRLKWVLLPAGPHPRTILIGSARGVRVVLDLQRETRLYLGLYEIEIDRHLRRLCTPGSRSFDVGGQWGYDALLLAKLSRGSVVSFECSAEELGRMHVSYGLNPELDVVAVHAYVGERVTGDLALDDYAEQVGWMPDFIKVDVDGGELAVLRGALGILSSGRPDLIVETHSRELELACGRLLAEQGYRVTVVHQRSFWPDWRPIPHNRWLVAER